MPKIGDIVAGKYEVERVIGEGGMGAVFAAMHKLTGRRVALKWMLPELARDADAVQRFMREAQAAGRINHPNVVDVYDVGQHDDSFFLVMEFLQGEPLTAALDRRDLSIGEVIDLLLPAMRGVAAAHRGGVVHRDLKPDNIFLCREEDGPIVPKVLDFGISKLASSDGQADMRLTKTGAVVGTPYYMSPEQIRGSHQVDKRSDVYAFGVILYEALTGQVPFNAETYSALILEIAMGTAKAPRELVPALPEELSQVVQKAMARELPQRFADMESFAAALGPFAQTPSLRTERRDPTGRQKPQLRTDAAAMTGGLKTTPFASEAPVVPRQQGGARVLLAVLALLAVAGAAWFAMQRSEPVAADTHVVTPAAASQAPPAALPPGAAAEPGVAPAASPSAVPQPTAAAMAPAQPSAAAPAAAPVAAAPVVAEPRAAEPSSHGHRAHAGRHAVAAAATAPPAAPEPAVAAPRPSSTKHARSGTLSVEDF
jgi:serine/threonine-protein kinase